jgi:hypothetical protein
MVGTALVQTFRRGRLDVLTVPMAVHLWWTRRRGRRWPGAVGEGKELADVGLFTCSARIVPEVLFWGCAGGLACGRVDGAGMRSAGVPRGEVVRMSRMRGLVVGVAAVAALAAIALLGGSTAAGVGGYEVWAVDQSDSVADGGGRVHIFEGAALEADSAGAEAEVVDLGAETRSLCLEQTGSAPRRPHMLCVQHTAVARGAGVRGDRSRRLL